MQRVKVYIRGWLGYFGIAGMKTTMQRWDEWLRRRFRCYIWKQWKRPGKRARSLIQLGIPEWQAWAVSNCRKAYCTWLRTAMYSGQSRKKDSYRRDITASLTGTSLCTYAIEPPCTERYARWCERSGLFRPLLLDSINGFYNKGSMSIVGVEAKNTIIQDRVGVLSPGAVFSVHRCRKGSDF